LSHKKAQKAQNELEKPFVFFVPFCGSNIE